VTAAATGAAPTVIGGATTVHTGEPWAGSRPYVVVVFALGLSLLGLGEVRRRRALRTPRA
jgi:MYXO-CTERM domain-containing protein